MPIYEYKCGKCGKRFELLRSLKENDAEVKCPKCGAEQAERMVSALGRCGGGESGGECAPKASG